jgi:hypothetical protein
MTLNAIELSPVALALLSTKPFSIEPCLAANVITEFLSLYADANTANNFLSLDEDGKHYYLMSQLQH